VTSSRAASRTRAVLLDRPPKAYQRALDAGQIGRAFVILFRHTFRVKRRALIAEIEREFLYGKPGGSAPVGILHTKGL
jgi:hypothetical protein